MNIMVSSIVYLLSLSSVLNGWNGKQSRFFLTSNRLIQAYRLTGVDSALNSVSVKQLFQYDYEAFVKALDLGIQFLYQGRTYQIVKVKGFTILSVFNKDGEQDFPSRRLSKATVKALNNEYGLNKDIVDVLNGLIKRGL